MTTLRCYALRAAERPAEILRYLVQRGHRIGLEDDGGLRISPRLASEQLRERVRARVPEIVAYLRELGAPAACAHVFVAVNGDSPEALKENGVCLSCGIPWSLHGEPPLSSWQLVDDLESVALIRAAAIVCAEIGERMAHGGVA